MNRKMSSIIAMTIGDDPRPDVRLVRCARSARRCHSSASPDENRQDGVDAGFDTPREIAGLELRRNRRGDDDLGERIRQRAFEAVADLDADLALLGSNDQQGTPLLFLAFSPRFQCRKSPLAKSSIVTSCSEGTVATTT